MRDEYDDIEPFLDIKRTFLTDETIPSGQNSSGSMGACPSSHVSQDVQNLLKVKPIKRKFHLDLMSDSLKLPNEVELRIFLEYFMIIVGGTSSHY